MTSRTSRLTYPDYNFSYPYILSVSGKINLQRVAASSSKPPESNSPIVTHRDISLQVQMLRTQRIISQLIVIHGPFRITLRILD